jgi:hypothetical protein
MKERETERLGRHGETKSRVESQCEEMKKGNKLRNFTHAWDRNLTRPSVKMRTVLKWVSVAGPREHGD